ncbi:MAG: hypothetical protein COV66_10445 [Nitrospinae bacterium CG11_big_fil_rev_8_21_14_0_20_45_15]|nr:MAG: hypothetical protein COV66_10445 [Nitrospinae bacterium CG11_big_fil_rev_8_21_14_0_20_45_15]
MLGFSGSALFQPFWNILKSVQIKLKRHLGKSFNGSRILGDFIKSFEIIDRLIGSNKLFTDRARGLILPEGQVLSAIECECAGRILV